MTAYAGSPPPLGVEPLPSHAALRKLAYLLFDRPSFFSDSVVDQLNGV